MPDTPVKNRAIYLIGGYEPKSADAFFNRTNREYARFGETWKLDTKISSLNVSSDGHIATVNLETRDKDWQVNTEFNFLVWNELVLKDFARALPVRLMRYLITFFDYVLSGTAFSFFRTNWRFAFYFLFPAVMIYLIFICSFLITRSLIPPNFLGTSEGMQVVSSAVTDWIALLVFFILLQLTGERWFALHLMDLWSFSRYYLRELRPDADARIKTYAKAVAAAANSNQFDEILLVGHSTGGALILDIAATALAADPKIASKNCEITILTVGSTALKIGLHPAAKMFRQKVQTLVDNQSINWVEYQSHTDIINFYKTDPLKEMRLTNKRTDEFPIVRTVRIREMLEPAIYKRVKKNFFRVHYQFIMGNTRPYYYDFFMICCAPLSATTRAKNLIVGAINPNKGSK